MKSLALLACVLISAVPTLASTAEIQRLEERIEAIGVRVLWSNGHGICRQDGLLGKYMTSERTVYICQENLRQSGQPVLRTLQHEGWHAVQHLCNDNNAALTDEQIRQLVSQNDREEIETFYPPHQWRAEAEARALQFVPVDAFINGVNHYCR